jgi:hypothetical protein
VRGDALGACVTNKHPTMREQNDVVVSRVDLTRGEYRHMFLALAERDLGKMVGDDVRPDPGPTLRPRRDVETGRVLNFSRHDLDAGLDDAANLTLERLVAMGILKIGVENGWREMFVWEWESGFAIDEEYDDD